MGESDYSWLSKNVQIMTIRRINIDYLERYYPEIEKISDGTHRPYLERLAERVIETYNKENSGTDSSAASGTAMKSENETEGCNEANEGLTNAVTETDNAEGSGTESPPAPENSDESENGAEDSTEDNIPVGTTFKQISFSDDWLNKAKDNTDFSILGFYCEVTINRAIDSLLEEAGAAISRPREISHIFVFYKDPHDQTRPDKRCMYTLTTGMRGYVPFQKFSDYHFPRKIAVRLLNPGKIKMTESKQVIGPVIWSRDAHRETPVYDPTEGFKVVTSFKAPLRPNSSMYSVPQFPYKKKKADGSPKEIELEITLRGIRIGKSMPFNKYPHILNHFEIISNGGDTFEHSTGEKKLEKGSEESFGRTFFCTCVEDRNTVKKLQNCLLNQLVKCFSEPDNHETWDVCHPKLEDYYKSSTFYLKFDHRGESYVREYQSRLSFDELREEVTSLRSELHYDTSALPTVLGNIQLGFSLRGRVYAPMLDCLMGQLDIKEQNDVTKTYYKQSKLWYEVDQDLLKTIDREFQRCMKECMLFDSEEDFLPDPWKTLKPTLKEISTQLNISSGDTKKLCRSTFSYVKETNGNAVVCSVLAGEILLNLDVRKYANDINKLLTESTLNREYLNGILKQGDESCGDSIWKELVKARVVGKIFTGKSERVLIMNPYYPNGTVEQKKKMVELANISILTKSEGEYNEGYLYTRRKQREREQPQPYRLEDGSGYLLGDRILPQGIELFDILYFTKTKTYLYHVKDGFDQDTRVACSQIRNSAIQLMDALPKTPSILDNFYDMAVAAELKHGSESNNQNTSNSGTEFKPEKYKERVRKQMEAFGKDNFMELFKRGKKNIVFVYAFLDSRTRDYCELTQDMVNKEAFSPGDFAIRDPEDAEQCLFAVGQSWKQRGEMLGNAVKIFKELVDKKYLDENGYRNKHFLTIGAAKQFELTENSLIHKKKVWEILKGGLGGFHSLIARFEVLNTRAAIQKMGFDFKICQIKQPGEQTASASSKPAAEGDEKGPTSLVYHRPEGGKFTITGFQMPAHETVSKSDSAFQALFMESCKTVNEIKSKRKSFVDELTNCLKQKNSDVLKLLKDTTIFLILEAAWREDVSEISECIKTKVKFLLSGHTNDTKAIDDELSATASKLKEPSNKVLEKLFKHSLCCCRRTASGIDGKGKVSVMDLLKEHYTWFIELISPLLMGKNPQGEFRELKEALNLVRQRVNEFFAEQTFSHRIRDYFLQEFPFTPYEFKLLAHVNKKPVEIIREGICSDEYECIYRLGDIKEQIIVREKEMLYERCELAKSESTAVP